MIVKGIISAVYAEEEKLSVILPEYDNMVTAPLKIYGSNPDMESYKVNDFVMVVMFNDDFNDGLVLAEASGIVNDLPLSVVDGMLCITYTTEE